MCGLEGEVSLLQKVLGENNIGLSREGGPGIAPVRGFGHTLKLNK